MQSLKDYAEQAKGEITGASLLKAIVVLFLCGAGSALPILHYVTHVASWTKIEAIISLGFVGGGLLVLIPATMMAVLKDAADHLPFTKKGGSGGSPD